VFNITFQQIETFLTVAKCLNLSKAGETLYASQPSLSKTLKRFEEGVGMRLFKSSNQGMALTSDGEYLFSVLEPLYKTIDKSIQFAQYNAATPLSILRIVEPSSYDYTEDFDYLKKVVKAFEAKYPDVKVQEYLCDFKELRQALEFGNADLVFTEDFGIREIPNVSMRLLNRFRLYMAISVQNPLARSEALDPDGLANETLYTIPTLADEQEDIQTQLSACRLLGFTPRRVEFVSNFQTLMHAISQGKGICFCPKLKGLRFEDDIRYYPVNLPALPSISVAWRTNKLSREAKNFINMLPEDGFANGYDLPPEAQLS
jgi:DNA-binding transcriptional LysR family regulator